MPVTLALHVESRPMVLPYQPTEVFADIPHMSVNTAPPVISETGQRQPSRMQRWIAAGATALSLVGGPSLRSEHVDAQALPHHLAQVELQAIPAPTTEVNTVPPPSSEALLFADKILSGSDNPRRDELITYFGTQRGNEQTYRQAHQLAPLRYERNIVIQAETTLRQEVADKYGVTVHDPYPYTERLEQDLYPDAPQATLSDPTAKHALKGQLPFAEYKKQADAFLPQYGVQLDIGSVTNSYSYNYRKPTAAELETITAKESVLEVIRWISKLPVELVQFMNLKHVVFGMPGEGGSPAAAYADASPKHDTITFGIYEVTNDGLLGHEGGHILDFAVSHGDDPSYLALNRGATYDVNNRPPEITIENNPLIPLLEDRLYKAQAKAYDTHDLKASANAYQDLTLVTRQVVFLTKAGNVGEEKADQRILNPDEYYKQLDPKYPTIRLKLLYSYARLAQAQPPVAAFLAETARHSNGNNWPRMFNSRTVTNPVGLLYKLAQPDVSLLDPSDVHLDQ